MPKIPKLSDITSNMPGVFDKLKNMFDNLTGPSQTTATEEALAKETDPFKAKLLEVELLINQINDLSALQNRVIGNLKNVYAELHTSLKQQQQEQEAKQEEAKAQTETGTQSHSPSD